MAKIDMVLKSRKLGKKPKQEDPRTLQFAKYRLPRKPELPPLPAEVSWITHVPSWPMFLNNDLGDCVIAAMGHQVQQWTQYANPPEVVFSDDTILKAYEILGGYIPGQPQTDGGVVMLQALRYWRKFGLGGHKVAAFVEVNTQDLSQVLEAIYLFGNLFTGLALPASAAAQDAWTMTEGGIYTPEGSPGSWGGHAVAIMAGSPLTFSCITWGSVLKMSHNFFRNYADEAYAVLSTDWLTSGRLSPGGFDIEQLQSDLAAL